MSVVDPSHTVLQGKPHPHQGVMENLLARHSELNQIHRSVFKMAKEKGMKTTPSLVDAQKLREYAKKTGIYDQLFKIVNSFVDEQAAVRGKMPEIELRPPPASELYGRMDQGASIVDVGTGDSKRLLRYTGFFNKVTAIDINLPPPKKPLPVHWAREERELTEWEEVPVLSFNVMAQMEEKARCVLEKNDGMHIAPNHTGLHDVGRLVDLGDKVEARMGGGCNFVENKLHLDESVKKGRFYVGTNTYKEREIQILVGSACSEREVRGRYKRPTYAVPLNDATWKLDGTFWNLRMKEGRGMLRTRNGKGHFVKSEFRERVELHIEQLGGDLYLLRVENYRGMRVFHSVSLLEKFCRRVKVDIGGMRLKPPPRARDILNPPPWADGIVVRDDDVDYVFNYGVSLDVEKKHAEQLLEYMAVERGISDVEVEGSWHDLTLSQIFERKDSSAVIRNTRRLDKKRGDPPDSWDAKFSICKVSDLVRCDDEEPRQDCNCDDDVEE